MSTIYLVSNNGTLSEKDNVLYYSDYLGNNKKLLPSIVEQIIVTGRLNITGNAFFVIFKHKIDLTFLTKNGRVLAHLNQQDNKNTVLRHTQHILLQNVPRTISIAKDIVRGKIHNQYLFIQKFSRKKEEDDERIKSGLKELKRLREILEKSNSINSIRGYEGDASKIYFSLYGLNFVVNWTSFLYRTKHPPLDPINAVLSFLYSILASKIKMHIFENGLDSSVGTLHSISYGRDSLVYDLIEEFRTPLVDTLTCSLFNLGILKPQDFDYFVQNKQEEMEDVEDEVIFQEEDDNKDNAVYLNEKGIKKVLEQFEKKLNSYHYYPFKEKTFTYRQIIQEQVKLYKLVVTGNLDHYLPLIVT